MERKKKNLLRQLINIFIQKKEILSGFELKSAAFCPSSQFFDLLPFRGSRFSVRSSSVKIETITVGFNFVATAIDGMAMPALRWFFFFLLGRSDILLLFFFLFRV